MSGASVLSLLRTIFLVPQLPLDSALWCGEEQDGLLGRVCMLPVTLDRSLIASGMSFHQYHWKK